MKEGEGISQRAFMHDSGTWTMVWGLPDEGGWLGRRGQREKSRDNYNKQYNLKKRKNV